MAKEYRIYRANKNNTGSATSWQLSYKKDNEYDKYNFFLVGVNQIGTDSNGNATFDWKGKALTVKMGEVDLGEVISVLEGRKDAVGYNGRGLYHESPKGGNKIVQFSLIENGYGLKISAQDNDKNKTEVRQVVSFAEASVLLVLLKRAVEKIYGW